MSCYHASSASGLYFHLVQSNDLTIAKLDINFLRSSDR